MAEYRKVDVLLEPVIMVGSHEPLSFRRRTGYASASEEERFAEEHSEEMVKGLARRGITWVRFHFFKGFGLEAEADEMEMTRRFVELCHEHGIKVELYTQFGTLHYETLLAEDPDMLSWCAVNEAGQHVTITYGHHDFRMKPCLIRDGWWKYLRRVLDKGLEIGGDGFGFDNVGNPTEPEACHCPECRKAFVKHLKDKYKPHTRTGRKRTLERFGIAVLDHVRPPTFNRWNPAVTCRIVKNPVFQEWMEFKCENLRRRFEEVWDYVKTRRPEMLIEYNVYPPFGMNAQWFNGIDMHRLLPWTDASWNERPPGAPEFRSDGLFSHKVHAYKLAEAHGAVIFTGIGGRGEQFKLSMAECLATNQGHLGHLGRPPAFAQGARPEADDFIRFRSGHPELFEKTESVAEVGLVESARTLAYNSVEPHYAEVLAMGSLLAGHLPFDLVPELTDEALSRYPALVLPDVECVTDGEAQLLRDYVDRGGALVVTERTSLYDAWRRRRREPALTPMLKEVEGFEKVRFGSEAGENINVAQSEAGGLIVRGRFGKGRVVYLSRLEPVKEFGYRASDDSLTPSHWHLPRNYRQFLDAVTWARGGSFTIGVTAPRGLSTEARRAPDGRLILHLVNYRLKKSASRVSVTLKVKVKKACLWTPGVKAPKKLRVEKVRGGVRIPIGTVERYGVVELVLRSEATSQSNNHLRPGG